MKGRDLSFLQIMMGRYSSALKVTREHCFEVLDGRFPKRGRRVYPSAPPPRPCYQGALFVGLRGHEGALFVGFRGYEDALFVGRFPKGGWRACLSAPPPRPCYEGALFIGFTGHEGALSIGFRGYEGALCVGSIGDEEA